MKTETKTGRWKYAAIVLIVTLLVGPVSYTHLTLPTIA